ncbi:hypothetical protein SAICODRAFT_158097 [Saitoella complicata NRRL Y-17804]|uniref:Protein rds1 n=1 Tax=Saitoella complicata (strain BCRC 22490 / CBS 7301 / JCM 7358 / NBRC 10748 / NRRL Y-17804) TaxID=698492 RepID=A0A0E9NN79_SAICN|nr:uncharacterized protein SAICODRAFT_158097 [Saitoella complicata NRRL Y-17804]ODQ51171.1 hypothetical protein SAICODRAFT_158097 [Saitoella complicata NRRL Y-17804]GAO51294.1 hypothetical protein G7K_5399-t1 [Saitoella complicata NRRL Y-17804]
MILSLVAPLLLAPFAAAAPQIFATASGPDSLAPTTASTVSPQPSQTASDCVNCVTVTPSNSWATEAATSQLSAALASASTYSSAWWTPGSYVPVPTGSALYAPQVSAPGPNACNNSGAEFPAPPPPPGGLNTNSTPPIYHPYSDVHGFDWQSMNLALNQEWIELDLFHHGLAMFSDEEFEAAGLNAADRYLLEFMADQEVGHATLLSNILGPRAAKQCVYRYPFHTVEEFIDFSQRLTKWGESGVYGFLEHLESRAAAQLLLQSITTEARQQMIFRQFEGLFPMPFYFTTGIPQSWAWTLLQPYIVECPLENPHIDFAIHPTLNVLNNPNATLFGGNASVSTNTTALSYPGREVVFSWDAPGKVAGYNQSQELYHTTGNATCPPRFAAWVSQLNTTYTPLYDVNMTSLTARTRQPGGYVFPNTTDAIVNGSVFVVLTDSDPYVTPHNLTMIDPHVVAGPAMYEA